MELGSGCSLEASLYPGCVGKGRSERPLGAAWWGLVSVDPFTGVGRFQDTQALAGSSPQHMDWVMFP